MTIETKEHARNYFNKLQETLGSDYKLKYYEVETDDDLKDVHFESDVEIEKIMKI